MKEDIIINARLVVKGFQNEGSEFVRSDSPTVQKKVCVLFCPSYVHMGGR